MGQKILIIGGSGFLGARLVQYFLNNQIEVGFTFSKNQVKLNAKAYQVDLTVNDDALERCITEFEPTVIFHCAIPKEGNEHIHQKISVASVEQISELISPSTLVIYLSTNAVFNGKGSHAENSTPQSRTDNYRLYGMTRAKGETVTQKLCPNALIIRTDTVNGYDIDGLLNPRLRQVVDKLKSGQPVERFNDRYITPTLIDNLVEALAEVSKSDFDYRGILHIAGSERLTDFEFTQRLAQHLRVDDRLVIEQNMVENPRWDASPRDNSLDVSKAKSLLSTSLLDVDEQLLRLFSK
ncbi:MAG: sugar nucleotide-binding protein [Chloroflexota bacterium]